MVTAGRSACLVCGRMNLCSGTVVLSIRNTVIKNECWISRQFKDVWCASPLYDWSNSDVWCANYRFNYDYNNLYDLYYKAGLKIDQMRVASPFNDYSPGHRPGNMDETGGAGARSKFWCDLWKDKSDGVLQYYVTGRSYLEILYSIFAVYIACPSAE